MRSKPCVAFDDEYQGVIIDINGDNGTSAEGTLVGTPNEVAMCYSIGVPIEAQLLMAAQRNNKVNE